MTDRERLVELIVNADTYDSYECKLCTKDDDACYRCYAEDLADDLLQNGVIVLPCKVGDFIWVVYSPKYPANPCDKGKWFMIRVGVQRVILGTKGCSVETWNMGTIPAKEIGEKLFITEEEAVKALKEREKP